MANNYTINIPLSINGVNKGKQKLQLVANSLPKVRDEFIKRSLMFIETRAKLYIRSTTGSSDWYELTKTLENSFAKDIKLGTLVNNCFYAGFVEYGTGIIGNGTHPLSKNYQYDMNGHGEAGWFFLDENGVLHWTQGMEAHRFMYDAINDYCERGEFKHIFNEVMDKYIGGIAK